MVLFGVGNGDDIDEMLNAPEGHRPESLKFNENDSLLDSASRLDACANEKTWQGMWARFDPSWLKFKVDVSDNFLNALGAICKRAQLQRCQNSDCVKLRPLVELAVPECGWSAFRDWAVTAVSCQYRMGRDASEREEDHPPHVHIASAVGLMNTLLEKCHRAGNPIDGVLLGPHGGQTTLEVAGVVEVIYWMLTVQTKMGRNTVDVKSWPLDYVPPELVQSDIERAERRIAELGLCLFRAHTLAYASPRKTAELPAVAAAVNRRPELAHQSSDHKQCTASSCRLMYRDNTGRKLLHDASKGKDCRCSLRSFSHSKLCVPIAEGRPAVWSSKQPDMLVSPESEQYIAISHTWADGTGAHVDRPGSVNSCMFDFFTGIAKRLNCVGIWWDAISIPSKRNDAVLRAQAISKMHLNYAKASYTVVHDRFLRQFEWREGDDSCISDACLAVALSPWFSRGWTSLELHISQEVVVLFASDRARANNSDDSNTVVIQPLSKILLKHPALSPRAHWVAAVLINKVWRNRIERVSQILEILHPRGTSWPSDIKLIQAHLAGCGDDPDLATEESEMVFTRRILSTVGSVSPSALLHGFETQAPTGPFSWCPRALSDMPISADDDFKEGPVADDLDIHPNGSVSGRWSWRYLDPEDTEVGALVLHQPPLLRNRVLNDKQQSYRLEQGLSRTPPDSVLQTALRHWTHCLLLCGPGMPNGPTILVETLAVVTNEEDERTIDCRYIATVEEAGMEDSDDRHYHYDTIRLGHPEAGDEGIDIRELIDDSDDSGWDDRSEIISADLESESDSEWSDDDDDDDDDDRGASSINALIFSN
ncbi:hypothetical protein F4824DRAFT_347098 [Ustulina deusta]|nr:hypothetical protein F4824DRAFT_347098 [Ustulina deusta]